MMNVRARHHERGVAAEEVSRQHEVRALAGGDDGWGIRLVHAPDRVREDTGGVDDGAGVKGEFFAGLSIAHLSATDAPIFLQQRNDAHVVCHACAEIGRRLGERDGQPRVVELAILIADAAAQVGRSCVGHLVPGLLARELL